MNENVAGRPSLGQRVRREDPVPNGRPNFARFLMRLPKSISSKDGRHPSGNSCWQQQQQPQHGAARYILLASVFLVGIFFSLLVQWQLQLSRLKAELDDESATYDRHKLRRLRSITELSSDVIARIPSRDQLELSGDPFLRSSDYATSVYDGRVKAKANAKPDPAAEIEAMSSLRMALSMQRLGKHPLALKLLEHAYALQPNQPEILVHYGEFLETVDEDVIEAEHFYARALALSPTHPRALVNRRRLLPEVEELDADHLRRIEQKRDELRGIPDASAALRRAKKEAYFQHIYHTVGLEGNTMTLSETRSIVETRLAVGGKSIAEHNEILGLDAALSFVNSSLVRLGSLSADDITEIHRRVMGFVDPFEAGRLRRTQVFVGSHVPPHPTEVALLLDELIQWLNSDEALSLHPIRLAALAHYRLVFIHPFADGNGRTSRLLMNLIMMKNGFPPIVVRKADRLRYYRALEKANEGDVRPFVRFIAECTEGTLNFFLQATREFPSVPELDDRRKEIPKIIV